VFASARIGYIAFFREDITYSHLSQSKTTTATLLPLKQILESSLPETEPSPWVRIFGESHPLDSWRRPLRRESKKFSVKKKTVSEEFFVESKKKKTLGEEFFAKSIFSTKKFLKNHFFTSQIFLSSTCTYTKYMFNLTQFYLCLLYLKILLHSR
jgi:hypothetical protein